MIRMFLVFTLFVIPLTNYGQATEYKNVIVLLDLSNRIKPDKNPNQAKKDQQIIRGILESFEERQRRFLFQRSRDKLSVVVANQRDSELNIHQFQGALSIDMANPQDARRMNKPVFDKEKAAMNEAVDELYNQAIEATTTGADIWSFFRDNLKSELKPSSEYQNYVLILTDGYMDLDKELAERRPAGTYMSYSNQIHKLRNKDNWEEIFEKDNMALKPHLGDYGNVKVLVLEVIPKDPVVNINELPILKKFWGTWFEQMEIPYEMQESKSNVGSTISVINDYVFN